VGSIYLDAFAYVQQDALMIVSAGNNGWTAITNDDGSQGGDQSINTPGVSKNALTVGASLSYTPSCVAMFSSRGPTMDTRIKPDVVAPGDPVWSAKSSGYPGLASCGVASRSGASMATPTVAGAAALLRQFLSDGHHAVLSPRAAEASTVKDYRNPSAALLKAMLVGSTAQMTHGYTSDRVYGKTKSVLADLYDIKTPFADAKAYPLGSAEGRHVPDYHQGFGRVQLNQVLPLNGTTPFDLFLYEEELGPYEHWLRTFFVADDAVEVDVTLAWMDPPGAAYCAYYYKLVTDSGYPYDTCLVHDLDLEVFVNGKRLYSNLGAGVNGTYYERDDEANNVEKVTIPTSMLSATTYDHRGRKVVTVGGVIEVYVRSHGLPQADSQPFAIVVTGNLEPPPPTPAPTPVPTPNPSTTFPTPLPTTCVGDCSAAEAKTFGDAAGFCAAAVRTNEVSGDTATCLDNCGSGGVTVLAAAHCACGTGLLFAPQSANFTGEHFCLGDDGCKERVVDVYRFYFPLYQRSQLFTYLMGFCPDPSTPPTPSPTASPTVSPVPSLAPSPVPTIEPTPAPSEVPIPKPTAQPTVAPTPVPSPLPTAQPTAVPTTWEPTSLPTIVPSPVPTMAPTSVDTVTATLEFDLNCPSLPTAADKEAVRLSVANATGLAPSGVSHFTVTSWAATDAPTPQPSAPSPQPILSPTAAPAPLPTFAPTTSPSVPARRRGLLASGFVWRAVCEVSESGEHAPEPTAFGAMVGAALASPEFTHVVAAATGASVDVSSILLVLKTRNPSPLPTLVPSPVPTTPEPTHGPTLVPTLTVMPTSFPTMERVDPADIVRGALIAAAATLTLGCLLVVAGLVTHTAKNRAAERAQLDRVHKAQQAEAEVELAARERASASSAKKAAEAHVGVEAAMVKVGLTYAQCAKLGWYSDEEIAGASDGDLQFVLGLKPSQIRRFRAALPSRAKNGHSSTI